VAELIVSIDATSSSLKTDKHNKACAHFPTQTHDTRPSSIPTMAPIVVLSLNIHKTALHHRETGNRFGPSKSDNRQAKVQRTSNRNALVGELPPKGGESEGTIPRSSADILFFSPNTIPSTPHQVRGKRVPQGKNITKTGQIRDFPDAPWDERENSWIINELLALYQ
jgi:hypothetical protein